MRGDPVHVAAIARHPNLPQPSIWVLPSARRKLIFAQRCPSLRFVIELVALFRIIPHVGDAQTDRVLFVFELLFGLVVLSRHCTCFLSACFLCGRRSGLLQWFLLGNLENDAPHLLSLTGLLIDDNPPELAQVQIGIRNRDS